jgi:hypothetical protein
MDTKVYRSQHEFVFVFKSGKEPHINNVELGKGNIAAARLSTKLLEAAASGNDKDLFEWTLAWSELQERKTKASCDPGSIEHFDVMYKYYMFKRDMRRGEGVEAWPFEDEEPYDDQDWIVFIEHHDTLKRAPKSLAPWPLDFPSNDPKDSPETA